MKTTVIFDLDGTLLDTITDITESVNEILSVHKLPTHSIEQYKYFVGNGFDVLVRKAIPNSIEGERFTQIKAEIKNNYRNKYNGKTKAYKGIIPLLKTLYQKGIKITVLSNKPHEFVKPTIEAYFKDIKFDLLLGARQGIPIKPSPYGVFNILEVLNVSKDECLYIGDTATDIKTGKSAGIQTVGVLWGFRKQEELTNAGADNIVSSPEEILDLLF